MEEIIHPQSVLPEAWGAPDDALSAFSLLHHVMDQWTYSKRKRFFQKLQELTRTSSSSLPAWPDVFVVLRDRLPQAISQAARAVIEESPSTSISLPCELQPETQCLRPLDEAQRRQNILARLPDLYPDHAH